MLFESVPLFTEIIDLFHDHIVTVFMRVCRWSPPGQPGLPPCAPVTCHVSPTCFWASELQGQTALSARDADQHLLAFRPLDSR
jgi:hypothetical protein